MITDCSNILIVYDQKKRLAYFRTPQPRYTPTSPYDGSVTQQQLDMRRKVEILKYKNNQQNTKTNDLTQKQLWALLARGNSSQINLAQYNDPALITASNGVSMRTCTSNETQRTWSSACGVPGPPVELYYDPTVPLYNYLNSSINHASYAGLPEGDTSMLKLYTQNEMMYVNQLLSISVANDTTTTLSSQLFPANQTLETRSSAIGTIICTQYMPTSVYSFSMSIPIGLWVVGSLHVGLIDMGVCPDNETPNWQLDPSYNPHIDPSYGQLYYKNDCYSKMPGLFAPDEFIRFHILNETDLRNLSNVPVSVEITFSGLPVTPVSTPTIYTSLTTPIAGQQHIQFADVSFVPYDGEMGQFYGVQYVGNLIIENLQLNVQPEQIYDLKLTMNYTYDVPISTKFDYLQSGLFFNLSKMNQNAADGIRFSSTPPAFESSSFVSYNPDSIIAKTTPTITSLSFGEIGVGYVRLDNIRGNFDTYVIYREETHASFVPFTTTLSQAVRAGESAIQVASQTGCKIDMMVQIGGMGETLDVQKIVGFGSILLDAPLKYDHPMGTTVTLYPSANHTQEYRGLTSSTFLDTSLNGNTQYTYYIMPIFHLMHGSKFLLGTITTQDMNIHAIIDVSSITMNTVTITEISGNFSKYAIFRDASGLGSTSLNLSENINLNLIDDYRAEFFNLRGTTFTDTALIPGMTYAYTIQPYIGESPGPKQFVGTITTYYPHVVRAYYRLISNTSVVIDISGYFSYVYIVRDGYPSKVYSKIYPNVRSMRGDSYNHIQFSDINVNTIPVDAYLPPNGYVLGSKYAYSVVPVLLDGLGRPMNGDKYSLQTIKIPINPLVVHTGPITINYNTSRFLLTNYMDFYYVTIQRFKNGQMLDDVPVKQDVNLSLYTDGNGPFYADSYYSYKITPYNDVDIPGLALQTADISPVSTVNMMLERITTSIIKFVFVNNQQGINNFFNVEVFQTKYTMSGKTFSPGPPEQIGSLALTDTSFIDTSFNTDTTSSFATFIYSYSFVPYNVLKTPGVTLQTDKFSPLPSVTFDHYRDISNVNLSFYLQSTNSYSYVSVQLFKQDVTNNNRIILYSPTTSWALGNNLIQHGYRLNNDMALFLPTYAYYCTITPYNSLDISHTTVQTVPVSPTADVSFVAYNNNDEYYNIDPYHGVFVTYNTTTTYYDKTDATKQWRSYHDMRVAEISGGILNPVYQHPFVSTTQKQNTFVQYNLQPYIVYQYQLVPINVLDQSGIPITTPTYSPKSSVVLGTISNTDTDVSMSFDFTPISSSTTNSKSAFYRLMVTCVTSDLDMIGSNVYGVSYDCTTNVTEFYDPSHSFLASRQYNYNIVSYNATGHVGDIITTPGVSPSATVSIGPILITNTDVSFAWVDTSTFRYVKIEYSVNGGAWINHTVTTYYTTPVYVHNTIAFTADSSYAYRLTPYNAVDVSNQSATLVTIPLSPMAGVSISASSYLISNDDISFAFINRSNFSYVSISRIDNGIASPYTNLQVNSTLYQIRPLSSYFYADNSYSFSILPYNGINVPNVSALLDLPAISPPATVTIGNVGVSFNDISFALTNVDSRFYYYVWVNRFVGGRSLDATKQPVGTRIYRDPSSTFYADTSYVYTVVPYNVLDSSNTSGMVTGATVSPDAQVFLGSLAVTYKDISFALHTPVIDGPHAGHVPYFYVNVTRIVRSRRVDSKRIPLGTVTYVDPSNQFTADTSYQYVIVPYNGIDVSNLSAMVTTVPVSPVATINIGTIRTTITDLSFSWTNLTTFYTVSVTKYINGRWMSGMYVDQPLGSTTYLDPSAAFSADTSYAYIFRPYNAVNTLGTTTQTVAVSPPATVRFNQWVVDPSTTKMQFSYTNDALYSSPNYAGHQSYYYVSIDRFVNGIRIPENASSTLQSKGNTVYTDPSLVFYADSSYAYKIIPYNAVDVSNTLGVIYSPTVSPPAYVYLSTLSVSGDSVSFSFLQWDQRRFYDTSLALIVNGRVGNYTHSPPYGTQTYVDPCNQLFADCSYQFVVTPYNVLGQVNLGAMVRSNVDSPRAMVVSGEFTDVSYSIIRFNFSYGKNRYYYVRIRRSTNGQWVDGIDIKQPLASMSYTDVSFSAMGGGGTYSTADSSYAYYVMPYNAVDMPYVNSAFWTVAVSPRAVATMGSFTSVSYSSVAFTWLNPTSYSYMTVAPMIDGIVKSAHVKQPMRASSYVDPSPPFFAYFTYSYQVIPYNAVDASGMMITTQSVSPPADVSFSSYSDISYNSLRVNYAYTTSFEYIQVAEVSGGVVGAYSRTLNGGPTGDTSFSTTTQLWARYVYNYQFLPYNALNVTNGSARITPKTSPTARILDTSFTDISTNRMAFTFNNNVSSSSSTDLMYYDVSVVRMVNGVVGSTYTNIEHDAWTYTDTTLVFDASSVYQYVLRPSNALGVAGPLWTTASVSNRPVVSFTSYTLSSMSTSIQLNYTYGWTPGIASYRYIAIAEIAGGVPGLYNVQPVGSQSTIYTSRSVDVSYVYSLIPYNGKGATGDTVTTLKTAPTPKFSVNSFSYGPSSNRAFVLNFTSNAETLYNYLQVTRYSGGVPGIPFLIKKLPTTNPSNPYQFSYNDYNGGTGTTNTFNSSLYYRYMIVPYNAVDVSGAFVVTDNTVVNVVSVLFDDSTGYEWNTNYTGLTFYLLDATTFSYVTVTPIIDGVVSDTSSTLLPGVASYTDYRSFYSDVSYCYLVTPYNPYRLKGTPIITPVTSHPSATVSPVRRSAFTAVTPTTITFPYTHGPTHYYYVSIQSRRVDRNNLLIESDAVIQPARSTLYSDPNAPFYADTQYSYRILPYNAVDAYNEGERVDSSFVCPLPDVSFVNYTGLSLSAITVNFTDTSYSNRKYKYVQWVEVSGGIMMGTYQTLGTGATSFTDGYLSPAITYQYRIVPYNALDVSGTMITTPNVSGLPVVTNGIAAMTGSTNIAVTFASATTFYQVSVAKFFNGGMIGSTYLLLNPTVTSYLDPSNQFYADCSYSYKILPYNAVGLAGTVLSTNTVSPDALAPTNVQITNVVWGQATITYTTTGRCYYVSILRNTYNRSSNVSTSLLRIVQFPKVLQYIDTDVTAYTADISINYVINPYNALNVVNLSNRYETVAVSPDASSAIFVSYVGASYVDISFTYRTDSRCSYVNITSPWTNVTTTMNPATGLITYRDVSSNATTYAPVSTNTATYTGYVRPDRTYSYVMVPYNAVDVSNYTNRITTPVISPAALSPQNVQYTRFTNTSMGFSYFTYGCCSYILVQRWVNGVAVVDTATTMTQSPGIRGLLSDLTAPSDVSAQIPCQYVDPSSSFVADSSYAYCLFPYNATDVSSGMSYVVMTSPISPPATVSIGNIRITTRDVSFSFLGPTTSFRYVTVRRWKNALSMDTTFVRYFLSKEVYYDPSNVGSGGIGGPFTANNTYRYTLIPYNAIDVSGTVYETMQSSPTATVAVNTSSISITTTSIYMNMVDVTSYSYIYVARIVNGIRDSYGGPPSSPSVLAGTTTYSNNNRYTFTADTSYAFALVPYNALDASGIETITSDLSPPATVAAGSLFVSSICISFNLVSSSVPPSTSYYQVAVARWKNGVMYGNYVRWPRTATTYVDPSNMFTADSSYSYQILPYNVLNVANTAGTYVTSSVSPIATVTFGTMFVYSTVSISVDFTDTTSYYQLSVARVKNGAVYDTYRMLPVGTTTYVDNGVFSADSSYSYLVIPYNAVNVSSGIVYATKAVSCAASVDIGPMFISTTCVSFNIISSNTFYQLAVARLMNGVMYDDYRMLPIGTQTYIDPSNVFMYDVSYSYRVKPYNAMYQSGTILDTSTVRIPGVVSPVSTTFFNIIDMTDAIIYFPFEVMSDVVVPQYMPPHASVIDTDGLQMYYSFDC